MRERRASGIAKRASSDDVHGPMAEEGNVGRGVPEGQIHVLGQVGNEFGHPKTDIVCLGAVVVVSRCVQTFLCVDRKRVRWGKYH